MRELALHLLLFIYFQPAGSCKERYLRLVGRICKEGRLRLEEPESVEIVSFL